MNVYDDMSAVPSPRFSPTFIVGENSATRETVLTGPTLFPQQSRDVPRELREKTREEVSTRSAATRVEEEEDREGGG